MKRPATTTPSTAHRSSKKSKGRASPCSTEASISQPSSHRSSQISAGPGVSKHTTASQAAPLFGSTALVQGSQTPSGRGPQAITSHRPKSSKATHHKVDGSHSTGPSAVARASGVVIYSPHALPGALAASQPVLCTATPGNPPSNPPESNPAGAPEIDEAEWRRQAQAIETQNLAAAMADSLQEDHNRKAAETPLNDKDVNVILEQFRDSDILKEFSHIRHLLEHKGEARDKMISMLEFEKQSCRWYPGPGTSIFFKEAAHECKPDNMKRSRRSHSPSRPSLQCLIAFMNRLAVQIDKAKAQVYSMPTSEVPAVFASKAVEEIDSDVEILEEKKPSRQSEVQTIEL